jgi:hypothetical protein
LLSFINSGVISVTSGVYFYNSRRCHFYNFRVIHPPASGSRLVSRPCSPTATSRWSAFPKYLSATRRSPSGLRPGTDITFHPELVFTVLAFATELFLTALNTVTELVLPVLSFLPDLVLTALTFLTQIVLTVLTFLTELDLTAQILFTVVVLISY